jgi:hypothetical protein
MAHVVLYAGEYVEAEGTGVVPMAEKAWGKSTNLGIYVEIYNWIGTPDLIFV